ncbi:MAG: GNAT family N-acetyltransferase [Chloroflexota bacterium]|nr:GNAT family N-acetyltransferase [Chloroflexota bacterium]
MLNFKLRTAELPDLAHCLEIDASYITTHVWQMEERFERVTPEEPSPRRANLTHKSRSKIVGKPPSPRPEEFRISLRPSRLPHPLAVPAPLDEQQLLTEWKKTDFLLVAETAAEEAPSETGADMQPEIIGYIGLSVDVPRHLAWISSQAVQLDYRRQGVGRALLIEALHWADRNRLRSIMIELQTKNYPAIQFIQKNSFFFCGYNSVYYPTREIALFFGLRLERLT